MAEDENIEMGQGHQGKGSAKVGGIVKGGKPTNNKDHDEMLHKMMPAGHKGDCGY